MRFVRRMRASFILGFIIYHCWGNTLWRALSSALWTMRTFSLAGWRGHSLLPLRALGTVPSSPLGSLRCCPQTDALISPLVEHWRGRCYPSLNSTVTFPFPDRLPCDLWPPDLPGLTSATSPLCVCGLPGTPYSAAAWKLAWEYRMAVRDDAQGLAKPDGQHCENCCIMYQSRFSLVWSRRVNLVLVTPSSLELEVCIINF